MKYKRLIISFLLLFILIILMIYYNQEYNNKDRIIQKYQHIFENFEEYKGTKISFSAIVKTINEHNQTITASLEAPPYTYSSLEINIKNIEFNISNLKKGDVLDIIGILDGQNHVTAQNIWKNEQWKDDLIYVRSLPAIPFALYLFFKTWKFNPKKIRFYRRNKDT